MNRSSRIALTAVAASAMIAGAAGVVAVAPLGALGPAAAQGPGTAPIASEPAAAPDPAASLDEALTRLTQETIGLQAELAAARRRLDSAGAAAPGPAAIPGGQAVASAARQVSHPAPSVHTQTGASSATGHRESEVEDD